MIEFPENPEVWSSWFYEQYPFGANFRFEDNENLILSVASLNVIGKISSGPVLLFWEMSTGKDFLVPCVDFAVLQDDPHILSRAVSTDGRIYRMWAAPSNAARERIGLEERDSIRSDGPEYMKLVEGGESL